jgi:hypothetical protein
MFIVTVTNNGIKWPLRGTVWAYDMSRAQLFETQENAEFALKKARPFMKAAIFKKARIEQVTVADNPAQIDNV